MCVYVCVCLCVCVCVCSSRDSPLKQQAAGSSIGGLCTKSMQLSVEKLHPSMLVRVGASQAPPIKCGTRGGATSDPQGGSKRRRLNHTTYSISVEEDDDGAGDSSAAKVIIVTITVRI